MRVVGAIWRGIRYGARKIGQAILDGFALYAVATCPVHA